MSEITIQEPKVSEIMIQGFNIDELFRHTMKKDWKKVEAIYQLHPEDAPNAKLTKSEETALHIAVSTYHADRNGAETPEDKIVKQLVESIPEEERKGTLGMINAKGDTPLHLAAAIGSKSMCQGIAEGNTELIKIRNLKGETPLFLAAHHGKIDAFTCLHKLCYGVGEPNDWLCRREDGDTILHSAISGEYFDLAYQIIHKYKKLVNSVNHEGFLPLHILARKPSIFESSSNFRLLDRFVYRWLIVHELKKKTSDSNDKRISPCCKDGTCYPENYETCMNVFYLPWKAFKVIVPLGKDSCKGGLSSCIADEENQTDKDEGERSSKKFPSNYATGIMIFKLLVNIILTMFGIGIWRIGKIRQKKEKHRWAVQIMDELIDEEKSYKYDHNGRTPGHVSEERIPPPSTPPNVEENTSKTEMQDQKKGDESRPDKKITENMDEKDQTADEKKDANKLTPVLLAARMGITEMVTRILETFPVAFQDLDENEKNVLLLAAESRQTEIYDRLLSMKPPEFVLYQVDNKGNGATHLAANFMKHQPWRIPGAALQMQWEIKWYKHVKHTMPSQCFIQYNKKGETANEVFRRTHEELVKNGSDWLTKTSESCSLVAALIATVAFATASTVPGGANQSTGHPILENHPAFLVFSIMSIGALCFSVTALGFFLAILTSRCQQKDFKHDLPMKLLFGLSSLFTSIAAMLLSFCAGHFFILKDQLQNAAFPIYTVACLPITFFAFAQLPLYFDLWWSITRKVPLRWSIRLITTSASLNFSSSLLLTWITFPPVFNRLYWIVYLPLKL